MKKAIKATVPLILAALIPYLVYSQNTSEAIVGKWLKSPKKDLTIEVYKSGDGYDGKIGWVKDNDPKKPLGFKIMEGLKYDAKKKIWEKGKISDPRSGKTYGARARINSDGVLELRAYKGISVLGRKKLFVRVK